MDLKDLKLEAGMYSRAHEKGLSFSTYLENYAIEKDAGDPGDKDVVDGIERDIYMNKTFGEIQKIRTELRDAGKAVPQTVFEKMLDNFEITNKSLISDFYKTSGVSTKGFTANDIAVLFPEWISQNVYATAMRFAIYKDFIAATQVITGFKYRTLYLEDTDGTRSLSRVAMGADLPRTKVNIADQEIDLPKYGRLLNWAYEVYAQMSLNAFRTRVLDRIARQIGLDATDQMIYVMLNGDGNSNGLEANQTVETTVSTAIAVSDIIGLASCLPEGYQIDKFMGRKTYMRLYWERLATMTNPAAQKAEIGVPLPPGQMWERSALTSDLLLGCDSSQALEEITNDTVLLTETDKIIQNQTIDTAVSMRIAFSVIDQDAIGALDVVHA